MGMREMQWGECGSKLERVGNSQMLWGARQKQLAPIRHAAKAVGLGGLQKELAPGEQEAKEGRRSKEAVMEWMVLTKEVRRMVEAVGVGAQVLGSAGRVPPVGGSVGARQCLEEVELVFC